MLSFKKNKPYIISTNKVANNHAFLRPYVLNRTNVVSNNQIHNWKQNPIYMDFQATTPLDPRVLQAMMPTLTEKFGNSHSRTHKYGWETDELIEKAREHIANLINCKPKEIIYTSGATESNNLAIKGFMEYVLKNTGKNHIITCVTEHKCVLSTCQYLEHERGYTVTYLPVDSKGIIDLDCLEASITDKTALITIMTVNNEIGVIQPIKKIAKIAKKHNVAVHTDAAQAVGKFKIDVKDMDVDMMSLSAHKMYGPKGMGALYVRSKPKVRLTPQIHGGGQERNYRSGTLPVPLCVGFGEAARIAKEEMDADLERIEKLHKYFIETIQSRLEGVNLNGHESDRYFGNCNLSFDCVEGESLIMKMNEVAVSSGSACVSKSLEPSYVLRALGVSEESAHTSLRFGIGKYTTKKEIDHVIELIIKSVNELREMSPQWELRGINEKLKATWT